jgi:hypothetical protein
LRFRPLPIRSSQMPMRCSRYGLFMALRQRSSRQSHRPMSPASPRRGVVPDLGGSRRPTTSERRLGH